MLSRKPVVVRQVWAHNLEEEFGIIRQILFRGYSFVSMDTEFPGTVFKPNLVDKRLYSQLHPFQNYQMMKCNVDALNLIQVGLTFSDYHGNLPDLGTASCYIWEFNFSDFDVDRDLHNRESIELLKRQGIDFQKNKKMGIHSTDFAMFMIKSGLVSNRSLVTWVTFHSSYDFGFLLKILIRRELPPSLFMFMRLLTFFFGVHVFDIKHMIKFCSGLCGGLERVAKTLEVDRIAGKSHQAGSDSLLTLETFMKMRARYFGGQRIECNCGLRSVLFGLEISLING